jgi:hypothetical protein
MLLLEKMVSCIQAKDLKSFCIGLLHVQLAQRLCQWVATMLVCFVVNHGAAAGLVRCMVKAVLATTLLFSSIRRALLDHSRADAMVFGMRCMLEKEHAPQEHCWTLSRADAMVFGMRCMLEKEHALQVCGNGI